MRIKKILPIVSGISLFSATMGVTISSCSYNKSNKLELYETDYTLVGNETSGTLVFNLNTRLESMEVRDGEFEKHLFHVWDSLDKLLAKHGYKREGYFYKVTRRNRDKVILFAHFGIMSAIVAHLMNIPFTNAAQFMICPPSGVTVFITEERTRGLAQFRMSRYGDTTHLGKEGIIRSFSGRFCELYTDKTRH